ncbi:complement factor H-related protein 2 [Chanos chanos]|uniref:Complement factor H-related protein 2 n=1 Tax=Chanos chanos TaxID=29144 RepID=A0A6J2W807_CHACN|nr:complement factor H-related protein 2-like [Chanos chanos]
MKSNLFVVFLYVCVSVDRSSTDNVAELESNIFLQPGQSVRVTCSQGSMIVENGQNSKKVLCQTNEIKCPPVEIQNGRIVNEQPEYKEDEQLRYECNKGFQAKPGGQPQCTRHGWSITPECEEIVCRVESRPTNAVIKPEGQTVFRPGQSVEITCSEGYWLFWTKDTSHKVLCKSDGQWERSLICEEITCEYPRDDHLYDYWSRFPRTGRLGRTSDYSCQSGYYKAAEKAKCTENGWQPKPLCLASVCEEPDLPHANIIRKSVSRQTHYTHGEWIEYECETGYEPKGRITIHCLQRDAGSAPQWSGIRQCQGSESGQDQCGPPPTIDSAEVISIVKKQYEEGNRVEYQCQAKYKISLNRHMTCRRGQWTGEVKCLKPCTITTAEMDKNNIEFRYGEENKVYAPHLDYITFQCKGREHQRHPQSPDFRSQCFDGVMTLPFCV